MENTSSTIVLESLNNITMTSPYLNDFSKSTRGFRSFSVESIVYITINAFQLLVSLYLCLAFWRYFKSQQRCVRSESIKECQRHAPTQALLLRRFSVAAGIILLLTTLSGVALLVAFQFFPSLTFCSWMSKTHYVLRTVTEILFNTILWLRQKIFYQHPAMSHLTTKLTSSVSWIFYVLMICSAGLSLFVFMFGYFPVLEEKCLMHKQFEIFRVTETLFFAIMVALIVLYRVLFLGLLLYPLIKHRSNLSKSNIGEKPVRDMMKVIQRVLFADVLCIALFIIVAVLTSTLLAKESVVLLIILWESELVLGFIFIMLSFVDWKKRLLIWHAKRGSPFRRSTRDASTRTTWMTISFKV